jgi:hypothetical protein
MILVLNIFATNTTADTTIHVIKQQSTTDMGRSRP